MNKRLTHLLLAALLGVALTTTLHAQTSAFTYQGFFTDGGEPFSGLVEFQFSLWDATSAGNPASSTNSLVAGVSNGLFTATLDFGSSIFNGADRWLQIDARTSIGPFIPLIPRQRITSTPYATLAGGVSPSGITQLQTNQLDARYVNVTGDTMTGQLVLPEGGLRVGTQALAVDGSGRVGIGTTAPLDELHVAGDNATLRLEDTTTPEGYSLFEDAQPTQLRISKHNSAGLVLLDLNPKPADGTNAALVRFFRETDTTGIKAVQFLRGNFTTAASAQIGVDGTDSYFQVHGGNLGIGTANPQASLHVVGTNILAGDAANSISPGVVGAVVAGGGKTSQPNAVTADYGAVVGGYGNKASGSAATAMGLQTTASGDLSTAMGAYNLASGVGSTAMGYETTASGFYSTAMGYRARANHQGAFVWADFQMEDFASTGNHQFLIRASGGVGIGTASPTHLLHVNGVARSTQSTWATTSDKRAKQDITPLENSLERLARLRPVSFEYTPEYAAGRAGYEGRFTGFIAQEVEPVFPEMVERVKERVGDREVDDFRVLNLGGITPHLVAAVQQLDEGFTGRSRLLEQRLEQKEAEIAKLKERLGELERRMNSLTHQLAGTKGGAQ